ncbi:MAG: DUF4258 domain-containing protein, partial [bacterium]
RMATRGITRTMVISALRFPDRIGKGYNNKTLAYKTFSNGTIKVVYTISDAIYVVISVMWEENYANYL